MKSDETLKRELAMEILNAALEKVDTLGFVPLLRERDASDRHSGRHHIKINRVEFIFVGRNNGHG